MMEAGRAVEFVRLHCSKRHIRQLGRTSEKRQKVSINSAIIVNSTYAHDARAFFVVARSISLICRGRGTFSVAKT